MKVFGIQKTNKIKLILKCLTLILLITSCVAGKSNNSNSQTLPQQISKALQQISVSYADLYADLIIDTRTEMVIYPAPFLQTYQIYKITNYRASKPILFYVAFAPNVPAYLLTNAPQTYNQLMQADAKPIETPQAAINYATTYLEVTRSMSDLFYLLQTIDTVKFRPNLNPAQMAAKEAFINQYRYLIVPPAAQATTNGYQVTLYAIREQTLEKHILTINPNGLINNQITILEQNLPLVQGL